MGSCAKVLVALEPVDVLIFFRAESQDVSRHFASIENDMPFTSCGWQRTTEPWASVILKALAVPVLAVVERRGWVFREESGDKFRC